MNKREYYGKMRQSLAGHRDKIMTLMEQQKALVQKRTGLNAQAHLMTIAGLRQAVEPINKSINDIRIQINQEQKAAQNEIDALTAAYHKEIDASAVIRAEDLTDDLRLLDERVPLAAKDVDALMSKHSGNHSMLRTISNYAANHNIVTEIRYTGFDGLRRDVTEMKETADIACRRLSEVPQMVDKVLPENGWQGFTASGSADD